MRYPLKDKIEGSEIDLSLNNLTDVPVQDLADFPKATHLDLSCNRIATLPKSFPTLTHLVKIDLSKNILTELPTDFGNLTQLQFLDLYENKIVDLPISFWRLRNLKWLDLKDNPLNSKIKTIAGDCLDSKQCTSCAKDVVSFMRVMNSELEKRKQELLAKERARVAAKLAAEARELERQRMLKKAAREKRKAEAMVRLLEREQMDAEKTDQEKTDADMNEENSIPSKEGSFWKTLLSSVFIIILSFLSIIGLLVFGKGRQVNSVTDILVFLQELSLEMQQNCEVWWKAFAVPYFSSLKTSMQDWMESLSSR